eukprot:364765-Chlamydomonas_euryale.AAC.3
MKVWGMQVWGMKVWGMQVWGMEVSGMKVWGMKVWGSTQRWQPRADAALGDRSVELFLQTCARILKHDSSDHGCSEPWVL